MELPSNIELRRVAHDLTMGVSPPRNSDESVNRLDVPENLVAEYLKVYLIVQDQLLKG